MGTPITKRIQNSKNPTYKGGMEISVSADGSGKAVPEYNPSPAKQLKTAKKEERTMEGKFDDALGNPKRKAVLNVLDRYDNDDEDAPRHATSSQYTTESIRNKMPSKLGNTFGGRALSALATNALGAAHEVKAGYAQFKNGRSIKDIAIESMEDMTNNLVGSVIGAVGNSKMDKSKNKVIDKAVKYLPDGKYGKD
jgi:hypothetical protein